MKKIILLSSAVLLAGCLNSSTVFANRSVIHVSTPELIGERASVTGSPTSSDSTVQADKQQQTPVNIRRRPDGRSCSSSEPGRA